MWTLLRLFLFYVFVAAGAVGLAVLLLIGHWIGYWLVAVFFIAAGAEAWKRRRELMALIR